MFLFTPDELAEIRAESRKLPLYSSVKIAAENGNEKAKNFIKTLDSLRKSAAYERSDSVIERLYDLTSFPQVMRSTNEGELKLSNLRLLIKYASDREKAGAHGLSAFIRFINRLEERESDLKPAGSTGGGGNCVRIMSVHGSKGLEFPVVFLAGMEDGIFPGQQNIGEADEIGLYNPEYSLSGMVGLAQEPFYADILFKDNDVFEVGDTKIKVLHIPGHTAGSVCYIIDNYMFTGDTLFQGTVGRTDLPTSDFATMKKSLDRLKNLEGDYKIFAGHGLATTLDRERKMNPFMV